MRVPPTLGELGVRYGRTHADRHLLVGLLAHDEEGEMRRRTIWALLLAVALTMLTGATAGANHRPPHEDPKKPQNPPCDANHADRSPAQHRCPEGPPGHETCSDGIDNDRDGFVDEEDEDCQQGGQSRPSCRASVVRVGTSIEPIVANGTNATGDPCATDTSGLGPDTAPAPFNGRRLAFGGNGGLRLLFAETTTTPTARAGAAELTLTDGTPANTLTVRALSAEASADCSKSNPNHRFASSSEVVEIVPGTQPAIAPVPENFTTLDNPASPIGISANTATTSADGSTHTRRAVTVRTPAGNVVAGEAIVDCH